MRGAGKIHLRSASTLISYLTYCVLRFTFLLAIGDAFFQSFQAVVGHDLPNCSTVPHFQTVSVGSIDHRNCGKNMWPSASIPIFMVSVSCTSSCLPQSFWPWLTIFYLPLMIRFHSLSRIDIGAHYISFLKFECFSHGLSCAAVS